VCPSKFVKEKKSTNMVINETGGGTSRYGNPLPYVLSVYNSPKWWMDSGANIHVCVDISLFAFVQVGRTAALLMENGSCAHVHGVDSVILKLTLGKTVLLKHVQHVPSIKKFLLVFSYCVMMVTKLFLSPISVSCRDMEHLLVRVMIVEVCSTCL
jgi:hypothetical protein